MKENHSSLVHYASPYYDPVKAHEYYMEHRELKGKSTSGLNSKGKEAASYIKQRLNEERDSLINTHREKTEEAISGRKEKASSDISRNSEEVRSEIASHSEKMSSEIERLRKRISHMSPKEKAIHKDALESKIGSLRAENQKQRESLQAELRARNFKVKSESSADIKDYRDEHSEFKNAVNSEYEQRYYDELDALGRDSEFINRKSSGKGKSKNASSVSGRVADSSSEALKRYQKAHEQKYYGKSNKFSNTLNFSPITATRGKLKKK